MSMYTYPKNARIKLRIQFAKHLIKMLYSDERLELLNILYTHPSISDEKKGHLKDLIEYVEEDKNIHDLYGCTSLYYLFDIDSEDKEDRVFIEEVKEIVDYSPDIIKQLNDIKLHLVALEEKIDNLQNHEG